MKQNPLNMMPNNVKDNCKFVSGTINIDEVVSVTVGGQTFDLE